MYIFMDIKRNIIEDEVKQESVIDIMNKILDSNYFYNPFEKYGNNKTLSGDIYHFDITISAEKFIRLSPIEIHRYNTYAYVDDDIYVKKKLYDNYYNERGFISDVKKGLKILIKNLQKLENYQLDSYNGLYKASVGMAYE